MKYNDKTNHYRRYWMRIILDIDKLSKAELCRKHYLTPGSVFNICKQLEADGFIVSKGMSGRRKNYELTEKGMLMRKAAIIIINNTGGLTNHKDLRCKK